MFLAEAQGKCGVKRENGVRKNPQQREERKKKKGACFTSPDLQQNCRFLRLHKVYQPTKFAGLAERGRARR